MLVHAFCGVSLCDGGLVRYSFLLLAGSTRPLVSVVLCFLFVSWRLNGAGFLRNRPLVSMLSGMCISQSLTGSWRWVPCGIAHDMLHFVAQAAKSYGFVAKLFLVTFFMVAGFFGVLVYLIDVGSGVCLLLVATAISCVCLLIVLVSLSWNSVVLGSFGIAHGIACLCVCMFGLLVCIWC